jgi:HSP20 family protein
MATTTETKPGLIRGLRDRLQRSRNDRRKGDQTMADIVRRNEYGLSEWDPFRLMREMMRMDPFRSMGLMPRSEQQDLWMPHFDVRENGNAIKIIADVPGVKREELEISVVGSRLVVSGRREVEERSKDENVHTWERQFGQFTRTFTLPDNVDLDHITSELREGVLTIVVPLKAGSRSRKIQIGGGSPKS